MFLTKDGGPKTDSQSSSVLRPYFAVPFGDMMLAGCFGLLAAIAEIMSDLTETIQGSLYEAGERGHGVAPWDS
jgi:hypothetical protein